MSETVTEGHIASLLIAIFICVAMYWLYSWFHPQAEKKDKPPQGQAARLQPESPPQPEDNEPVAGEDRSANKGMRPGRTLPITPTAKALLAYLIAALVVSAWMFRFDVRVTATPFSATVLDRWLGSIQNCDIRGNCYTIYPGISR
jgi:hypothetical protein